MTESDAPPDDPGFVDTFEAVIVNLRDRLLREVAKLDEALETESATTQQRFQTFTGYFKMVQGIELMLNGIRQQREQDRGKRIEVVEFRQQLEEQISRLVDQGTALPVSGETE